jgi:hypothetical protein
MPDPDNGTEFPWAGLLALGVGALLIVVPFVVNLWQLFRP